MADIDDKTVQQVWEKGEIVAGCDPNVWRKDACGAWIRRNEHGNRHSEFGWEIDHIQPASKGGSNAISNLRPLQWENNASRQDGSLECKVTAKCGHNIDIR